VSDSGRRLEYPNGKKFAFTVIDDTDVSTVENVAPVYTLLRDLGLRTTKTVWPLSLDDPDSDFVGSETLEDPEYLDFVLRLQREGFEITWHSPAMESSTRPRILTGLDRFQEQIGHYPRIHVSHARNRENPYWGSERVDSPIVRWFQQRSVDRTGYYQGHVEGSEYWWGDRCLEHIEYGRNLTFETLDLTQINPSMPYRDPVRPLLARWFSASDAEDVDAFVALLRSPNQAALERAGGFSIVATHFGKEFVSDGVVDQRVRSVLEEMAGRPGWFPTVGELLDWLREQHPADVLPPSEWRRMQYRFLFDGIKRRLIRSLRR
jgi:hypothetical protein